MFVVIEIYDEGDVPSEPQEIFPMVQWVGSQLEEGVAVGQNRIMRWACITGDDAAELRDVL